MSKVQVFSLKSKTPGSFNLPGDFVGKENPALIAQAVHVSRNRSHIGSALTKDRGDVVRTTKKWFRQKGTGHARHGARSAPIFVGGGVAHGPDGAKRTLDLPQKMRKVALKAALAIKVKESGIVIAEALVSITKTKDAQKLILSIAKETKSNRFTLVLSETNKEAIKAFRNLKNVNVVSFKSLNAHMVVLGGTLIFDSEVFPKTSKAKKATKEEAKTK